MTAASLAAPPCAAHTEGQICELVCSSLLCLPLIPAAASSPQPASLIRLHRRRRRRRLLLYHLLLRHSCQDHRLTPPISHKRLTDVIHAETHADFLGEAARGVESISAQESSHIFNGCR